MSILDTANRFYKNSKRLLFKSTKKPSSKEFWITARITAIGIILFGGIGFVISLVMTIFIAT